MLRCKSTDRKRYRQTGGRDEDGAAAETLPTKRRRTVGRSGAQLKLLRRAHGLRHCVAKSEVAQAEAQVKMAETNIDRLTMRAPIAAILQNKVRLGQFAQCGPLSEPLMILEVSLLARPCGCR